MVSSPIPFARSQTRLLTPNFRRGLASLQCNSTSHRVDIEKTLLDLIECLKNSTDSSTQLLIRLYNHKSIRLSDEPDKLSCFQQEIYTGLRRLHPTVKARVIEKENGLFITPQPIVTSRSAQATIRKLH